MSTAPLGGKTAFIVGANGGMATASARIIAQDGGALFLMGRSEERLNGLRDELLAEMPGAQIGIFAGDTFSEADVKAAAQAAHDFRGRLDIVVSTVGEGQQGAVLDLDLEAFLAGMNGSIISNFLAVRYSVPLMKDGGSIVCISSTAAKLPFAFMSPYCAGKAGLEQFVRAAAIEFGPLKVRINCVRPGLTGAHTTGGIIHHEPLLERFMAEIPLGRTGVSADIGGAVRYFAGPESDWVTGQSFAVDGGNELRRAPDFG